MSPHSEVGVLLGMAARIKCEQHQTTKKRGGKVKPLNVCCCAVFQYPPPAQVRLFEGGGGGPVRGNSLDGMPAASFCFMILRPFSNPHASELATLIIAFFLFFNSFFIFL